MKKKKIFIIVIVIVLILFALFGFTRNSNKGNENGHSIEVTSLRKENIESKIINSGKVKSKSTKKIMPSLSGVIESIEVSEGELVEEGQVLAYLASEDLKRQLVNAEISLKIDKLNLAKLTNDTYDSNKNQYTKTKLNYEEALQSYKVNKQLFELGSISQSILDESELSMKLAEQDYNLAEKTYFNDKNIEAIKIQELQIKLSEENIKNLKEDLEKTKIVSPIKGTITGVYLEEGDLITPSSQIFLVEDLDNMEVETYINEYEVAKLSLGQIVNITGLGVKNNVYSGKISFIGQTAISSNIGNSTETVVEVRVDFDEETEFLPNYTADLEIITAQKDDALVLSYDALYIDRDGVQLVYKVVDDKIEKVIIEKGIEGDLVFAVNNNELLEGDRFVLNPTDELEDGLMVNVVGDDSNDKD